MPNLTKHKLVTNDEFNLAYSHPQNQKVIKFHCYKFGKGLPPEESAACGLRGLWRALSIYDKNKGQFTTILGTCIKNECRRTFKEHNKFAQKHVLTSFEGASSKIDNTINSELIESLFIYLTDEEEKMVRAKFLEGKTYREIGAEWSLTKQRVEQVVSKAIKKLSKHFAKILV